MASFRASHRPASAAALERRRSYAVDGLANALLAQLPRLLPRALAARISGNITRPRPTGAQQAR